MDFNSYEDVDHWLQIPGNSIDKLREHLVAGRMSTRKAQWAHNWLRRHDDGISREQAEREFALQERGVRAAERSATWAGWAIGVSVAALALSAWPYLREWLE